MVIKFNNTTKNYRQFTLHYQRPFTCKGKEYMSLYHYLMTLKYDNVIVDKINAGEKIYELKHTPEIRKFLNQHTMKPSKRWRVIKYSALVDAIRVKFYNDIEFKELLLSTGNYILEYINPMDEEWATGVQDKGENLLGKALMDIRKEVI